MDFRGVSRNDPCPCGSGRKYKKCCYRAERWITQLDRAFAIELLDEFIADCDERRDALDVFRGDVDLDVPAMTDHFRETSEAAFLFWFAFDHELGDGTYLVDRILKANPSLPPGPRRYLEQMRETAMMPYEVVAVRPGSSVVLRRLGAQEEIEVRERTASKILKRWDLLVARLNPLGPTGGPEIEMGVMNIARMDHEEIAAVAHRELGKQPDGGDSTRLFKDLGPLFHEIWLESILAPRLPVLHTRDGDQLEMVTMWFDVLDEERVRSAFAAESSLQCDDDTWSWIVDDSMLGTVSLEGPRLKFLTNSKPRSDRGRQLIERIAQDAVVYRGQDCVDPREEARKAILSGEWPETPAGGEGEIPPEIKDQLFQEFMAKHNQHWLDDQIPALDHQTPRFAAQSPLLQPRLVALLKEIENQYLHALAAGEPAFDPTWMWEELGLADHQDAPSVRHAVRLAHESMEESLPGILQAITAVAEQGCADGAGQVRTAITQHDLRAAAHVLQLIDDYRGLLSPADLLAHLEFYCNWEMQRRKTFWVDESLAWMLANTQVDAESSLFRLPFPSYVLVYTDRHTLSVAERALASDQNCPLRGQMLAVLCAYVVELDSARSKVRVGMTFDSLAGQPPHLMTWELHVDPNETLEKTVDDALSAAQTPAAGLFRPLLDTVINATLYTTSAGTKIEQFRADRPNQPSGDEPDSCDLRDSVYYLPGKIEISHLRKLRQVARGPSGCALMHRFMVRGHWRRPNANWKNQSLRWIEPYWRGPSLATIIEREYRLNP